MHGTSHARHRAAALVALAAFLSVAAAREGSLVQAIQAGDATAVRALLQKGSSANEADAEGMTALHWAVLQGGRDVVAQLLNAGAKPDTASHYGVTPLMVASHEGNAAIVGQLLKAGANANAARPSGETVLMTAARTGNPAVIRALLAARADPNAKEGVRGQTALMWAAAEDNAAASKLLIEVGADVHARTAAPARKRGGTFSQQVGADAGMARRGNDMSFTALLFAVTAGKQSAVETLLDAGANVNDALPDGTSALMLAAQNANWEIGNRLIDRGADVNAMKPGWTALHEAVHVRRTSRGGMLPPPVSNGNATSLDFIKRLIKAGADVNARMKSFSFRDEYRTRFNRIEATPFLLAAKSVDTEVMQLLLESGANPRLTNAEGTTALMVASGLDLWLPGEDGGTLPEDEPEALQAVRMLLDLGLDVNAVNSRGETALHGAAYKGADSITAFLIETGARLDSRNEVGWTPWTIANGVFYGNFFHRHLSTIKLLDKAMADRGISTEGMAADKRTCFDCGNGQTQRANYDPDNAAPATVDSATKPAADKPAQAPAAK